MDKVSYYISKSDLINNICPLGNMKTNFKFEVDWGNGSKDIAFTIHICITLKGVALMDIWIKLHFNMFLYSMEIQSVQINSHIRQI